MATSDIYLPDTDYYELLNALTELDRDPAHPHPLRDRIAEVIGEIGGLWPKSVVSA
ncbi:hypothetical protein [Sulfitobacter pontiacus]|jgi:hypothetical protein|uniref:hypothetical protein n=1 Tax=Sulfitobacter pontiacus TaxID=60137 RepID=UPI0030ED1F6B|tara:strand:+ start:489 stop:656 length:168 start_codon:yes stop_codon:yes gene_type:complete